MIEIGVTVPEYADLTSKGKTPLYFATEAGEFLGTIVAADVLKESSAKAVEIMRSMHLDVVMLTGDNKATATAVAQSAGIEHVICDVLPGDKAGAIDKLRMEGHNVLMVGDGINDAPALVTADVGMAIGAGTDIAIESASVVLMNDSLIGVCQAIELSKATIRNIRQNLFWAFFYNCLGIPIAAGALYPAFHLQLSPMIGAAAMSFSSVFVVTNALRLRLFNPKASAEQTNNTTVIVKEEKRMETIIQVEGMMCPHCKARVEKVCKEVPGTVDAVVDLNEKNVTVTGSADVEALKKAIIEAGYEVVG
jgi:Cu+-exporting ATPase